MVVDISEIGELSMPPSVMVVSQVFPSHDAAKKAYMEYAGWIGFDARMCTIKVVDGIMTQRHMICSKQGYYSPAVIENDAMHHKKCRIQNTRCGYVTMIYLVLDPDLGGWHVVSFVSELNHEKVSLNKRRCLQVNQVITPLSRAFFESLSTSNIAPSDQYSIAENEFGGFSTNVIHLVRFCRHEARSQIAGIIHCG